jgi:hypothetical protein
MSYKSVRLLVEAINGEMDNVRKALMSMPPESDARDAAASFAIEMMNELRKLVDELVTMADRPTVDDVLKMKAVDYVATMKPLVRLYHQALLKNELLAQAICEDVQAAGVLLVILGDGKIVIGTAYDPNRPEVAIAIEAMVTSLDNDTKKLAKEGVEIAEEQLGITPPTNDEQPAPLRVRYYDRIREYDQDRNAEAELVIDMDGVVIKDALGGEVGRKATDAEIDSCIVVKDPGSGVGYCVGYHDDNPCGAEDCFVLQARSAEDQAAFQKKLDEGQE